MIRPVLGANKAITKIEWKHFYPYLTFIPIWRLKNKQIWLHIFQNSKYNINILLFVRTQFEQQYNYFILFVSSWKNCSTILIKDTKSIKR